jgi:AcrR family transcriptional regulator
MEARLSSATRPYDGRARRADAETRRRRVVEVAHRLFLEQGYGATSIAAIAAGAGVAAPTVYAAFTSKAGVLARVVDVAVAGHHDDVALREGAEFAAVSEATTTRARIRALARGIRVLHERSAAVLALVASVAGADPAVAALHAQLTASARSDGRAVAELFAGDDDLRDGLDADGVDKLLTVIGAWSAWMLLVQDEGMTPDAYEDWLIASLDRLLLR